ncbi:hypothetical protein ACBC55_05880 [Klebsiella spallanzanii]
MTMKKSGLSRNGHSVIMIMAKMGARIAAAIVYVSVRTESTDAKSAIGRQSLMTTYRSSGESRQSKVFLVAFADAKKRTNLHNF